MDRQVLCEELLLLCVAAGIEVLALLPISQASSLRAEAGLQKGCGNFVSIKDRRGFWGQSGP